MNFVLLLAKDEKQQNPVKEIIHQHGGKRRAGSSSSNYSILVINSKYDDEINSIYFIQVLRFVESLL